jgi:hypothetical protein
MPRAIAAIVDADMNFMTKRQKTWNDSTRRIREGAWLLDQLAVVMALLCCHTVSKTSHENKVESRKPRGYGFSREIAERVGTSRRRHHPG